ncbi:MAG: hypothetical protein KDD89_03920, partial [Anaerolineales bacterium]|nr:hypothetical protein [Anaerolineales bacterium]
MRRYRRQGPPPINLIDQPAGLASRTAAMLIDIVAISLGLTLFTYLTSVVLSFFGLDVIVAELQSSSNTIQGILGIFVVLTVGTILAF